MDGQHKINRGQFLTIVGGAVFTVAFSKFFNIKDTLVAVGTSTDTKNKSHTLPTYGNSTYGGKSA